MLQCGNRARCRHLARWLLVNFGEIWNLRGDAASRVSPA